jgi:hypothetical protein
MADHELVDENERDRFAGTSAERGLDRDGDGVDDRQENTAMSRDADGERTASSADAIEGERNERFTRDSEFERGREVGHDEEIRRS